MWTVAGHLTAMRQRTLDPENLVDRQAVVEQTDRFRAIPRPLPTRPFMPSWTAAARSSSNFVSAETNLESARTSRSKNASFSSCWD
jgi:hypothetical protein